MKGGGGGGRCQAKLGCKSAEAFTGRRNSSREDRRLLPPSHPAPAPPVCSLALPVIAHPPPAHPSRLRGRRAACLVQRVRCKHALVIGVPGGGLVFSRPCKAEDSPDILFRTSSLSVECARQAAFVPRAAEGGGRAGRPPRARRLLSTLRPRLQSLAGREGYCCVHSCMVQSMPWWPSLSLLHLPFFPFLSRVPPFPPIHHHPPRPSSCLPPPRVPPAPPPWSGGAAVAGPCSPRGGRAVMDGREKLIRFRFPNSYEDALTGRSIRIRRE